MHGAKQLCALANPSSFPAFQEGVCLVAPLLAMTSAGMQAFSDSRLFSRARSATALRDRCFDNRNLLIIRFRYIAAGLPYQFYVSDQPL